MHYAMSKGNRAVSYTLVDDALQLDAVGNNRQAYCKYLEGIQTICNQLIDQERKRDGMPLDAEGRRITKQTFSVVRKCLERLEALIDKNDAVNELQTTKESNMPKTSTAKSFPDQICRYVLSGSTNQSHLSEAPKQNAILEITNNRCPIMLVPAVKSRQHMSAMEHAQRENALLYYAYEKRISQPTDRSYRISLHLELQRRMAENLALAKAKDAAYREEEMKKEKKALERAARKLFRKGKNAQDACDSKGNKKEWEKQWLYAQMLRFEDQESWPASLRKRLKTEPERTAEAIRNTLSTPDYPLVEWMNHALSNVQHKIQTVLDKHSHCMRLTAPHPSVKFQTTDPQHEDISNTYRPVSATPRIVDGNVLSMFDPLLSNFDDDTNSHLSNVEILHQELLENSLRRQLNNIITDITNLTDTLVQLISLNYEISSEFHESCYQTVAEHVYSFLWWKLQVVFRMCNEDTEKRISQSIKQLQNQSPDELDVPTYFSQLPDSTIQSILSHLQSIIKLYIPISKLQILVQVVEMINNHAESQAQLNADDLISIISYLIVQLDLPQLSSECDALDCLVPHTFLMGEEGFVLTTFQTALKYLETQMDSVYSQNL